MFWGGFDRYSGLADSGSLAAILRNEPNFSKLHVWGGPLDDLICTLDLIKHIRCTVYAELWLIAIRTDPRGVRIVPVFLHSNGFGADLRGGLPVHAIGRLIWSRTRLQRIGQVDIGVKPGGLATDDSTWLINMLRVFLCVKSCSIRFPFASSLMVLPIVSIWARHKRFVLIIRENAFRRDRKRHHRAFPVSQCAISLHRRHQGLRPSLFRITAFSSINFISSLVVRGRGIVPECARWDRFSLYDVGTGHVSVVLVAGVVGDAEGDDRLADALREAASWFGLVVGLVCALVVSDVRTIERRVREGDRG